MIRLKGDARTPSCFAVAGPPAVPECRKAASLAVAAGAYVKSMQRSQAGPVFAHGSGPYLDSKKGAPLDRSCTWLARGPYSVVRQDPEAQQARTSRMTGGASAVKARKVPPAESCCIEPDTALEGRGCGLAGVKPEGSR